MAYEQYVTTLYPSGRSIIINLVRIAGSGRSSVSYTIKEGYYDYDIHTDTIIVSGT